MVIGDSDGMYATSEGDYYVDLVDILPGDVYKKEITIRSLDLEEPFSLGMLVEEIESNGSVDWKNHITVTLTLDGEQLYQGPLLGEAGQDWSKVPLELGVCKYGTDKLLTAEFAVDPQLTNENLREASTLKFYWTFVGTKDQPTEPSVSEEPKPSSDRPVLPKTKPTVQPNGKRLPQTGEHIVYKFLSGLLLILIALFLWKKRREEEKE
ncbi:LPXTG-domain-containing protein cell wall anchor domain [Enterococcus pallens]|nr:LPXTG-domain-containing protein cell wall anchor domain [Enterococcus pallens]